MSTYKHGMASRRLATKGMELKFCKGSAQVVIGVAPVNTLKDPSSAVEKPILIEMAQDVKKLIGFTSDNTQYNIMHSMYACFDVFGVSPVIVINVLNPNKPSHKEVVAGAKYPITKMMCTVEQEGILLSGVVLTDGADTTYTEGEDYELSFSAEGYLVIAVTEDGKLAGANEVNVAYTKLDPSGVTMADIIGGTDEEGIRHGIELLDDVYIETGYIPYLAVCPGYSTNQFVASALVAKMELIGGLTNGRTYLDVDCTSDGVDNILKLPQYRTDKLPKLRLADACWPMVKSSGKAWYFSAFAAALNQESMIDLGGVPSESISNQNLKIDGICLPDGKTVRITQDEANDYANAYGVITAIRMPTWKAWGNNSLAYPYDVDVINRWSKCVFMLNYLENKFKTDYLSKVDRSAKPKFIRGIVNEFNAGMNALVADGHLAGGEIVFSQKENPIESLLNGHIVFHTRYADFIPAEYIENVFEYDINMLEAALYEEASE